MSDATAAPAPARFRLRGVWSDAPLVVRLLVPLYFLLAVAYSVAYPAYLGLDEPQHVDVTVALTHELSWPDPGQRPLSTGVARTSDFYYSPFVLQMRDADDAVARGDRQSLEEAGGESRDQIGRLNQMVQHPPLAYALGAAVLEALPGTHSMPYDRTVGVLRLLSALLTAPLPLLIHAAARRVAASRAAALTAALLPLVVAPLFRIAGSWTNDTLLTLLVVALTTALVFVATGDVSRSTAVWVGSLTLLALLTKGFALTLPVLIAAAYHLASRRTSVRAAIPPLAVAAGFTAVGGLWWLRNVVSFGAVQPQGRPGEPLGPVTRGLTEIGPWVRVFLRSMEYRFWGALGFSEPPATSSRIAWACTAILVTGLVLALLHRPSRQVWVIGILPTLLIAAVVAWGSLGVYRRAGTYRAIHGRYLYPGVGGLAVLVAVGYAQTFRRLAHWLPVATVVAAVGSHALAFRAVLPTFWTGPGMGARLDAVLAWSPWPEPVVVGALLALLVLGAAVGALLVRDALAQPASSAPPSTDPERVGRAPSPMPGTTSESA